MSVALVRVDDRLVHGQVVVGWGRVLHPKRIWVADDGVAENPWEIELLRATAEGVEIEVCSVAGAAEAMRDESGRAGSAIFLFRTLPAAARAHRGGAEFSELQIGGLHFERGKERVLDYLYLDDADREAARRLTEGGVRVYAQDVPGGRSVPVADWATPAS